MISGGLDEVLFRGLADELIQAFGVQTHRQRLDSTAVRSAMRELTGLGTVVAMVSKFPRELARVYPQRYAPVDPELRRRYLDREGEGCFASTKPSESKRRLPEAGRDLLALVEHVCNSTNAAYSSNRQPSSRCTAGWQDWRQPCRG